MPLAPLGEIANSDTIVPWGTTAYCDQSVAPCIHRALPDDIGRTKIPTWLLNYTKKDLHYEVTAGGDFPDDLSRYKMIISCGGCMVNRREIMHRIEKARAAHVAITNYGILMAYLSGILERVVAPFRNGLVKLDLEFDKITKDE